MNTPSPILPDPPGNLPPEVAAYLRQVLAVLRNYFREQADPATIGAAKILVPIDRFPTAANVANLRPGSFYNDGGTVKVKE